jgi:hypothetical protein
VCKWLRTDVYAQVNTLLLIESGGRAGTSGRAYDFRQGDVRDDPSLGVIRALRVPKQLRRNAQRGLYLHQDAQ